MLSQRKGKKRLNKLVLKETASFLDWGGIRQKETSWLKVIILSKIISIYQEVLHECRFKMNILHPHCCILQQDEAISCLSNSRIKFLDDIKFYSFNVLQSNQTLVQLKICG